MVILQYPHEPDTDDLPRPTKVGRYRNVYGAQTVGKPPYPAFAAYIRNVRRNTQVVQTLIVKLLHHRC